MTSDETRHDGESWESYARRLEHRIKEQRDHITHLVALHDDKGNRADRKRIALLERSLGQMAARWQREKEAREALIQKYDVPTR